MAVNPVESRCRGEWSSGIRRVEWFGRRIRGVSGPGAGFRGVLSR